jgi:hypothetical protein
MSSFELLVLLHSLLNEEEPVIKLIRRQIKKRLIDDVNVSQIVEAHSMSLITGEITLAEFLEKRYKWYEFILLESFPTIKTFQIYDPDRLTILNENLEKLLIHALMEPQYPDPLQELCDLLKSEVDKSIARSGKINVQLDVLCSTLFAAMKKLAFEEVYNIVADYNPMPAREPDQQGVVAELYILGSRCVEFFDIPIYKLSEMLYNKRMEYLKEKNPSEEMYNERKFMLTYLPLVQCGDQTKEV